MAAESSAQPSGSGSGTGTGGTSTPALVPQQQQQQQQQHQQSLSGQQMPSAAAKPPPPSSSAAMPIGLTEAALDSPTFRAVTVHFTEQLDMMERWLENYTRSTSRLVHDMLGLEEVINGYLAKMMPPAPSGLMAGSSSSSSTMPSAISGGGGGGGASSQLAVGGGGGNLGSGTNISTGGVGISSTLPVGPGLGIVAGGGADQVIDADYTLLALRRTSDGARGFWSGILGTVRRLEPVAVEPIRAFVGGEMRTFRETRRALEQAQKQFDTTLARYVAQSKTKEPSSLREDAFAVYETRKLYLKASMDFCQMAPQLRSGLDKLLVTVSADLYREMRRGRESGGGVGGGAGWGEELERIRGWSREMEASEGVFRRELQMARRNIGEKTLALYKPSRELEDYSVSTVPYLGSRGPMSVQQQSKGGGSGGSGAAASSEKQGWLFLRVLSGKPVRTTWVRRWYYCRNGIFGWLVQGPQGVLQGDEIGVLLCSAKPAVQEERRFCFEVKTKAQTLLVQAETQAQLMEWLEAFEASKKKAFEASMGRDQSALSGGVDPAFAITAPTIPEFSARILESADEGSGTIERTGTLPVPGQDGNLVPRPSGDFTANPPRRSITTLGREEGESGRDHAARIMQKLDLHRKATFASSADANSGSAAGLAGLITSSQSFLPGYSAVPALSSGTASQPGQQRPPNPYLAIDPHHPGSLAPTTLAKPPIPTYLSNAAVVASSSADPGRGLPTAVMANYWGSSPMVPDGALATNAIKLAAADDPFVDSTFQARTPTTDKAPVTTVNMHRKTMSVDTKAPNLRVPDNRSPAVDMFPPNYPPELRAQYAQFRLVFPRAHVDEKPVLVFNAAWSSASGVEGREGQRMAGNGRIFVTPDNMYFYGHQMGLVTAYSINLDTITEVTAAPGKDCDYIFLHLSQEMNDMGLSRIAIKVFLEDFALLHARLNLLVDDLQAEEPMDLSEIITALVNLESEDEKKSPSAESWEEVSSNTPIDDGTAWGRPVSRRVRDLNLRYRHGRAGAGSKKALPKLQLPSHPVVYEPEDGGRCVAERHFEMSAKACFHVLFGDKSFIFPKLYFERRAKEIAQGPWELQDHGKMRRQFKFKVDYVDILGRVKPGNVTDTQTIDIFNEHITYVVTHVKTPWHLPQSQAFKLVTKVVITHVAKSKCKLAIYTKADWSKTPAFAKGVVQRQALNDATNDAEELAEVATDQVRKLGPHSRTKRAIQVYGNVGRQAQVVVFTPNEHTDGQMKANNIRPRTLTDMLVETGRSFLESAITSLMMWTFAAVRRIFKIVSAHRVMLVLLLVSAAYNLVVVSQASSSWWAERKAARYMSRIGVGPNLVMSKAIYVRDLEEAAGGSVVEVVRPLGSQCYDAFQSMVNTTNPDAPYSEAGAGLLTSTSKATARRLRRTRQRLGGYRHDLLVAVRVVNGIEREMMQSEWENWLMDENARCEHARSKLLVLEPPLPTTATAMIMTPDDGDARGPGYDDGKQKPLGVGKEREREEKRRKKERDEALRTWYNEYCGSCEADQRDLIERSRTRGSLV